MLEQSEKCNVYPTKNLHSGKYVCSSLHLTKSLCAKIPEFSYTYKSFQCIDHVSRVTLILFEVINFLSK